LGLIVVIVRSPMLCGFFHRLPSGGMRLTPRTFGRIAALDPRPLRLSHQLASCPRGSTLLAVSLMNFEEQQESCIVGKWFKTEGEQGERIMSSSR